MEHDGHRQRMMEKLQKGGLLEHEILEILLFFVIRRRNTNDLAHRLLAEFGTLEKLFSADMARLEKIEGVGPQVAKYLYTLGLAYHGYKAKVHLVQFPMQGEYDAEQFMGYIGAQYEGLKYEVLDFYLLSKTGAVQCRRRFIGKKDRVTLETTAFTKMLLDNRPGGIIAVHNHPNGKPAPSVKDNEMTRMCQMVCSVHNVLFCDHIITAENGIYSYYHSGLLRDIQRDCEQALSRAETQYIDEIRADFPQVLFKDPEMIEIVERDDGYVGILKERT